MIKSIVNRFKNTREFKQFYKHWITTLKTTLLPHLTHTLFSSSSASAVSAADSATLSTHVNLILAHFTTYFAALDAATSPATVDQLLHPPWRSDLVKPFLWLGDFHPYSFTNLLRSLLDEPEPGPGSRPGFRFGSGYGFGSELRNRVENIECGLRLMVPAISKRAREAQGKVVVAVGGGGGEVAEVVAEVVEEMTCLFLDANRLRRSVVCDIVLVLSVDQAAFFLHGLSQFYVGFSDSSSSID